MTRILVPDLAASRPVPRGPGSPRGAEGEARAWLDGVRPRLPDPEEWRPFDEVIDPDEPRKGRELGLARETGDERVRVSVVVRDGPGAAWPTEVRVLASRNADAREGVPAWVRGLLPALGLIPAGLGAAVAVPPLLALVHLARASGRDLDPTRAAAGLLFGLPMVALAVYVGSRLAGRARRSVADRFRTPLPTTAFAAEVRRVVTARITDDPSDGG